MYLLLKVFLLAASMYGYMQFFSQKIKPEFAIGFIFASIGSIMFFSGILNIMPFACFSLFAIGIALAVISLKDFKNSILRIITPGTIFFIAVSIIFIFIFKGQLFSGGDAYHHWGIITNVLIDYDRFPTTENYNITFPAYPPGSASFIYFFAKICGANSAWFAIVVQSVLTLGMFIGIFAFCKNKFTFTVTCAAVCIFTLSNEPLSYLVVDNLIAAIAACAIAFCIYYKEELFKKAIYLLPFITFLVSVKNSGVLFAFFVALYYFISVKKDKSSIAKSIGLISAPFITLMLWQKHVDLIFPTGLSDSQHAMSIRHYTAMYNEKLELGILEAVWNLYSSHVFTINNVLLIVAAAAAVYLIFGFFINKKLNKNFIKICLFLTLTYITYQIGLLGTYIFSMPSYEMNIPGFLPSYGRYHLTIIVFICCVMYVGMLKYMPDCSNHKGNIFPLAALLVSTSLFAFSCKPNLNQLRPVDPQSFQPVNSYRSLIDEYHIPKRHKYLIIDLK